ncbi:MAG: hypothetical protein ACM3ZE_11730 [Myxococcales bacterium]
MSKLSDAGARHQWRHPSVHSLSSFDRIPRGHNDRHPVEIAVDNRIGDRVRRKWIVRLQNRILALLGPNSGVYMKLEAMLNEQALDRERNFFNVGYEYGMAEHTVAGQMRLQRPLSRAEQLVRDLLRQAFDEQISRKEVVAALLRCALSIVDSSRNC